MNACDIYSAPSRLEGFGMPQVEAGACAENWAKLHAKKWLSTFDYKFVARRFVEIIFTRLDVS